MPLCPPARLSMGLLLASFWARPALAEAPRFLQVEGFAHLLDGSPESTSLSEEGAIGLRPRVVERFADAALLAGAAGLWRDDVVLAQLSGEPQLVAIDAGGKVRTLMPLGEQLVTKLAADGATLWMATTGKDGAALQRLGPKGPGAPQPYPEARYIWDVLPLGDGGLLLATGEPGAVVLQDASGRRKTLFRADEAHIKTLLADARLGVFAGGGERGVVYHGDGLEAYRRGKGAPFRALLDTRNAEVTALVADGNYVFVSAVTGQLPAPAGEGEAHAGKGQGEVRSALMRLDVHGAAETLAGSSDEMILDLARTGDGQILVATASASKADPRGRLYRIDPARKVVSLLMQAPSRQLSQLLVRPGAGPILVAHHGTRLLALSDEVDEHGVYLTASLDAGVTSRFGAVQLLGELPAGSSAEVSVRTGQTKDPDASWSQFSPAVAAPGHRAVQVPNGRYAQMRLRLTGRQKAQPSIWRLRLTYLRQNLPPFIREVSALPKGTILLSLPQAMSNEESRSKITTVAEPQSEEATQAGPKVAPRVRQVPERGAITIKWVVDEPNGDQMRYTLWAKRAGSDAWRLVKDDLRDPFYTFHSAQLADGHYIFRVQASDAPDNPAELALTDTRESRAILVDNTPPHFVHLATKARGKGALVTGEVRDALSPLVALTYALDGGELRPMRTADGLLDGLTESCRLALAGLEPGAHAVTFRARDEADNEAFAQVEFTVR